jgi:hypothetical protein
MVWARRRWRRMVRQVKGARGGQMACRRLPSGIGLGVGLIQPASGDCDRAGGEGSQLRLGPEPGADPFLGAAGAQHERLLMAIDQQLLHILISQVALQRSQPQQGVEHRLAKTLAGGSSRGTPPARRCSRWASASCSAITDHTNA